MTDKTNFTRCSDRMNVLGDQLNSLPPSHCSDNLDRISVFGFFICIWSLCSWRERNNREGLSIKKEKKKKIKWSELPPPQHLMGLQCTLQNNVQKERWKTKCYMGLMKKNWALFLCLAFLAHMFFPVSFPHWDWINLVLANSFEQDFIILPLIYLMKTLNVHLSCCSVWNDLNKDFRKRDKNTFSSWNWPRKINSA